MCSIDSNIICIFDWEPVLCSDYLNCSAGSFDVKLNGIPFEDLASVNVEIPEELAFDYSQNGAELNINISWYNVNTEYMDDIIEKQSFIPSNEDLSAVVQSFVPYMSIMIFILFLIFVFNVIKKVFK